MSQQSIDFTGVIDSQHLIDFTKVTGGVFSHQWATDFCPSGSRSLRFGKCRPVRNGIREPQKILALNTAQQQVELKKFGKRRLLAGGTVLGRTCPWSLARRTASETKRIESESMLVLDVKLA